MWPLRNIPIGLFSIATLSNVVLGQSYTTGNDNLTTDAISACDKIANGSAETVAWSLVAVLNTDYEQAKDHFWSAANADLTPACVVFPTTAEEVSFIVGVLLDYPSVPFAVKSGGHNSNMGFSSVNWGVLISFSKKATTTLSTDKTTADVEPGARWGEVITALEPDNVAVVGGRIGDVGVAGLLLGGGCSFLSAQYGFAADNVVNYEVVLANTSIVNVNAQEYSDLFFALRGGGGQFGIVTKFTLKTYPIGQIWGGVRTYDASLGSALLNATQQFSEENTDPKAAVIVTGELVLDSLLQFWTVFFFYNGTSPPAGVFGGFESLPTLTDSVKTRSYADFLVGNNALNVYGFRYLYRAATIPNLPAPMGKVLYNDIYNNFRTYIESIDLFKPDYVFDLAFQPLSQLMASASQAAGGNIMQLDPNDGDRMWIEIDISWLTPLGDDDAYAIIKNVSSSIESYAQNAFPGVANTRFVEGNLIEAEYNPLFLNDAMPDQNPVQSYGNGTYAKLQEIYKKYDPNLFFATRTGGFKYV